jgi:hypothetical protein
MVAEQAFVSEWPLPQGIAGHLFTPNMSPPHSVISSGNQDLQRAKAAFPFY